MIAATVTGYLSALSLILAIGAQNAFVLRQSLTRNHIFAVCLFCALSDTVLIVAGALGFGAVVTFFPALPKALAIAGACFLAVYALIRLREAFRGHYLTEVDGNSRGLRKTLLIAAALTWLNPHVYLDTMGLLGAISTQYETTALRAVFSVSASVASFTFFFALGYGGRFLAPVMRSVRAWRILDTAIALVMAALAVSLLRFAV